MAKHWWRRAARPGPGEAEPGAGDYPVPPSLATWAQVLDVSRLSQETVQDIEKYLQDYRSMQLAFSREQGLRLRTAVAAQVSPPPPADVHSLDVLATVLTVRRKQLGIG